MSCLTQPACRLVMVVGVSVRSNLQEEKQRQHGKGERHRSRQSPPRFIREQLHPWPQKDSNPRRRLRNGPNTHIQLCV